MRMQPYFLADGTRSVPATLGAAILCGHRAMHVQLELCSPRVLRLARAARRATKNGGLCWFIALAACGLWPQLTRGQATGPKADPRDMGLVLPRATPQPGRDRRALVQTDEGQAVVARVYLEIGDRFVVLLPDGRLTSRLQHETTITERPFEPASKKEIAKDLVDRKFRGFRTRTTKHYLYVYNTSQRFFEGTSRILETMYPNLVAYCKRQKLPAHAPETPLIVIMFHTEDEFSKYRKMPSGVVAYYNEVNNHVVMYEQSNLAAMAPEIAVKQSISTIAHEGVHQVLYNTGAQRRLADWPMWISEGLPEFFAPTNLRRRVRWAGLGQVNQLRLHALVQQFKKQPIAGDGSWLRKTISADRLDGNGYAAAWAITHFLAKSRKPEFSAYLQDVSQRKPLQPADPAVELFEKHFGSDYAGLEASILKHLGRLPYIDPIANQPHYVAALQTPVKRLFMMSTSPVAVQQWHAQLLANTPAAVRRAARFNVKVYPNRSLATQAFQALRN